MRNPNNILEVLRNNSTKQGYKYEGLYRNLYNKEFYLKAYAKLYAKEGNMTPGTDGLTIDGFSMNVIENLIESLKNETYKPKPSKRKCIAKKNSEKLRPLEIPAIYDKFVQEIIREMLEAIYEDTFSQNSHGFRPNRSCHTALLQIKTNCTGARWWIEGDIKGFFDNINHNILINLLKKRIKDEKLIRLIWKFLKAGYLEDFKLYQTYSGTPQGGIISPILANIYLDEFDKYMEEFIKKFDKGAKRKENKVYKRISNEVYLKRKLLEVQPPDKIAEAEAKIAEAKAKIKEYKENHPQIKNFDNDKTVKSYRSIIYKSNLYLRKPTEEERQKLIVEIKERTRELQTLNTYEQIDDSYRRMKYVRYADDFLISIIGTKEEAEQIKAQITTFINDKLSLTLSQEKTLITHKSQKVRFLGYDIFVNQGDLYRKREFQGRKVLARTATESIKLSLPHDVLVKFMLKNGYIKEDNECWKAVHRAKNLNNDDLEIVSSYNSEFRGFYQYYKFAFDVKTKLGNAHFIFKQSFCKTLAGKYRTKVSKLMNMKDSNNNKKYFREGTWGITWTNSKEITNFVPLFHYDEIIFCKKIFKNEDKIDNIPNTNYGSRNSLIARLKANICEWCGDNKGPFEIHHVRKLKDLKGKKAWEKHMISRRRKTLVLCAKGSNNNCHQRLHNGELD